MIGQYWDAAIHGVGNSLTPPRDRVGNSLLDAARRWRTLAGVKRAKHTHVVTIALTSTVGETVGETIGETVGERGRKRGSTQSANNSSKQAATGAAVVSFISNAIRIPAQYTSLKKRMKDT